MSGRSSDFGPSSCAVASPEAITAQSALSFSSSQPSSPPPPAAVLESLPAPAPAAPEQARGAALRRCAPRRSGSDGAAPARLLLLSSAPAAAAPGAWSRAAPISPATRLATRRCPAARGPRLPRGPPQGAPAATQTWARTARGAESSPLARASRRTTGRMPPRQPTRGRVRRRVGRARRKRSSARSDTKRPAFCLFQEVQKRSSAKGPLAAPRVWPRASAACSRAPTPLPPASARLSNAPQDFQPAPPASAHPATLPCSRRPPTGDRGCALDPESCFCQRGGRVPNPK